MNDMSEFLKHLRSTHFVLVVTSLVVLVGLSSVRDIYNRALEQLNDIVEVRTEFDERSLIARIRKQAKPLQTFASGKEVLNIEDYLRDLIVEHFEWESWGGLDQVRVTLWGFFKDDWIYEFIEESSFFYSHAAVLAAGDDNRYYFVEQGVSTSSLARAADDLSKLLAYDRLLHSPELFNHYQGDMLFRGGTPIREAEISQAIESHVKPELSAKLVGLELTSEQDRERYKAAALAAEEDPEAWNREQYEPDFFIFEVRLKDGSDRGNERSPESIAFSLRLPVFFKAEAPQFMADILQERFPDRAYYARHQSGARSFSGLFPELDELSRDLKSLNMVDLRNYFRRQAREGDAPISMLGVQFSRDLVEVWGLLVLLSVQLYFSLHFRTFLQRHNGEPITDFPWIGIYPGLMARTLFRASLALPVAVCAFVGWKQYEASSAVDGLTYAYGLIAIGLFASIEWTVARSRRTQAQASPPT